MFRDIVNKLSGGQITTILLALILIPGAVGAGVTFQPVTIVDPTSGLRSYIDTDRRLHVYDQIAGYRNSPENLVYISLKNRGGAFSCDSTYTVPAGKALVLTAITGYEYYNNMISSGFEVVDGANCSGLVITKHRSSVAITNPSAPVAIDFGSGVLVRPGRTLSVSSYYNLGYTFLHGYLVPATAIPTASVQETNAPKLLATDAGPKP